MPGTSDEHRARWPGEDEEALQFLLDAGYRFTNQFTWLKPSPDHIPTEREDDALDYLCLEWDWGGLVDSGEEYK